MPIALHTTVSGEVLAPITALWHGVKVLPQDGNGFDGRGLNLFAPAQRPGAPSECQALLNAPHPMTSLTLVRVCTSVHAPAVEIAFWVTSTSSFP